MELYQLTVDEYRVSEAFRHFEKAADLAKGAKYGNSIEESHQKIEYKMQTCSHQFQTHIVQLLDQLGEVMHPARAARVIAANSRIEASQAGEYLQSLQAVAESVDNAAQIIHDNVQRCRRALSYFNLTEYSVIQ